MAQRLGLWGGLLAFAVMLALPAPEGMTPAAWRTTAIIVLMAAWWMTEALPLTATALIPFLAFPLLGIMTATEAAASYYSPILFLVLGGAIIALAIERTGLHRRLALAIVSRGGGGPAQMLLAFMAATATLSMIVSNTATTLIMMPIGLAILRAAKIEPGETRGFSGALAMGIAFAATIGGFGTLVGSPTNAIAAGIIEKSVGYRIDFLTWAIYGVPLVLISIPLCWFILMKVQRVSATDFDPAAAREGIGEILPWSTAEKRLVPLVALTVAAWIALPFVTPFLPKDSLTDGTIAVIAALLLFVVPDGSGRGIINWEEANRAPWGVIMMFGGGLALAAGIGASGLADWMGVALQPLRSVPTLVVAAVLVGIVIIVTEFASNVATASGAIPVVAGIIAATGIDPILLALPAAFASSWGFML
ncbi:MAG TPA: DASS family sodium-coupled anion symporter, partial [Allosphingosinicella sp.]|nr:DASS family sodium-coupled anion symporter [Allosphingosinicella sp.]